MLKENPSQENPSQEKVDEVIAKYVPEAMAQDILLQQQARLTSVMKGVVSELDLDRKAHQSFKGDLEKASAKLQSGSDAKPLSKEVLSETAAGMKKATEKKISDSNEAIKRSEENEKELQRVRSELEEMTRIAHTDQLTGAQNRRSFDEKLEAIFKLGNKTDYSLVVLDIDHFKKINDSYGHTGGDAVLKHVASAIGNIVRSDAFVARTGGEEFAFIIKSKDENVVKTFCERVRTTVEAMSITSSKDNKPVKVTISLGAGVITKKDTPDTIYDNVDKALYKSKNTGRNRTTLHLVEKPTKKLQHERKHKNLYSNEFTEEHGHDNPSL